MTKSSNILISTGKTGGHIIPAFSVGEKYIEEFKEAKVIYAILNDSFVIQDILLERSNFVFLKDWQGFNPKILIENVFRVLKIMKTEDIKKVLIFGSYLSLPVIIVSLLTGSKLYLHEQNVLPGRANRFASLFSRKIFISYAETAKYFLPFLRKKIVLTGNPVRKYFLKGGEEKKQILFLGGSQGAEVINRFIIENIDRIKSYLSISFVVITGKKNYKNVVTEIGNKLPENLKLLPFANEILDIMFESRLIVSRAGAVTLSEIAFLGKPSVLVPYPYAQDNHQYVNARHFEKSGGAFVVEDSEIKNKFDFIINLFNSPRRLKEMGESAHALFIPDSEVNIVKNLC